MKELVPMAMVARDDTDTKTKKRGHRVSTTVSGAKKKLQHVPMRLADRLRFCHTCRSGLIF